AARRRTLAALQSELDEPSTVAGRALVSLGYGPGHPYAHPAQGFRRDVDTFQREDALSFHATRYQQQGALLAAVGQSTPTELIDLLTRKLQQWEASWPGRSQRGALQFAALAPSQPSRAVIIHKPDATQAQVRIVAPGLPRSARRYLAGLFPLGLESHEALAEQIADALLDGLGLEHLKTYRSRVLAVTAAQAREMAAELSPARDGALLVVVGEAEASRRALDGLCPIEARQLEEFG